MKKTISIDEVTTEAVRAALAVLDEATDRTSKRSAGPMGDELAYALHRTIEKAMKEHFEHPDFAPAFVVAKD